MRGGDCEGEAAGTLSRGRGRVFLYEDGLFQVVLHILGARRTCIWRWVLSIQHCIAVAFGMHIIQYITLVSISSYPTKRSYLRVRLFPGTMNQ